MHRITFVKLSGSICLELVIRELDLHKIPVLPDKNMVKLGVRKYPFQFCLYGARGFPDEFSIYSRCIRTSVNLALNSGGLTDPKPIVFMRLID